MTTDDDMTASMDSVPSVVDPSGSSDQSQNVGGGAMDLSGQSFSGPSFLSSTDFMSEGPQAHIPGPCPMAMIDQHSVATADPYFCLRLQHDRQAGKEPEEHKPGKPDKKSKNCSSVKNTKPTIKQETKASRKATKTAACTTSEREGPRKDKESTDKAPVKPSKHSAKKNQLRKRKDKEPSSSDSDSSDDPSSSGDFGGSSDWEHGLEEELAPAAMPTSAAPIAFRPCIHYNTVEKFDPDSKREVRVNWWERFVYVAALGM
ncbi:hypothetical protein PI126_g7875 [Phytophthora idaei]|nr:hypothetical protein PI126_g7875 [Phytophthora idaei]